MRDKCILLGSFCLLADVNIGETKQELNSVHREKERNWADGEILSFKICFVCEFGFGGFGFGAWGLGMEQGGSYYDM